jgi:glycosyltransferase involved in cell wall biosynthesis
MQPVGGDLHSQDWDDACVAVSWRPEAELPEETVAHVANRAAVARPDADLVLVLADAALPAGWLERLRFCAATESTAATVSAVPGAAISATGVEEELSRSRSLLLDGAGSPRVELVGGGCVLILRAALRLLGSLDETMPTSAGALAEFGLRARQRGLANLLAGDVLVAATGAGRLTDRDRSELARRFPALWQAATDPPSSAIERSLALAWTATRRLSVTVDARSLGARTGGTQVYTLELIKALARTGEVDVRALVGPDAEAKAQLEGLEIAPIITYEQALDQPEITDLVHRPQQAFTLDDLDLLRPLGRRLVITHLDLIAYHNPTYFEELEQWRRHVRATRAALDVADHVLFCSAYALRDAEREELIDGKRASVVALGVDPASAAGAPMTQPAALAERPGPFLLCIGADYAHKNRPFALELTAQLRRAHAWPGTLVLAGAHVQYGSSMLDELRLIENDRQLENATIDLGSPSDEERLWLMSHADAVVYPTVSEGFGLVPFEAAAAGVPCLFAGQSSLGELLPAEIATLDGWDLERAAALAAPLLSDESARRAHVEKLREATLQYSWSRCAEQTIAAYQRTLRSPARTSARHAWEALQREREIVRLDQAFRDISSEYTNLVHAMGADGMALVGPGGLLSDADRRTLLALATRPALGGPLFAAGRAGYRLAHRGKAPR